MASLPAAHPSLTLHLADRAQTPLITSSRTETHAQALASLTHTSLLAHETALRLGLGIPQRIMLEHADGGPVVLQSFLNPVLGSAAAAAMAPSPQAVMNGHESGADLLAGAMDRTSLSGQQIAGPTAVGAPGTAVDAVEEGVNAPPLLVGIVVAPTADEALEARRAASRLERVGKEVQTKWAEAQQAGDEGVTGG